MINQLRAALCLLLLSPIALAQATEDDGLKYFVIQGKPKPEVINMMVENPANPMPAARALVASIEGAKLVDYYFKVGSAENLAIIAVPDSMYAAAITYQRMGSELMEEMIVYEVIPASKVPAMLETAKAMNEADAYSKSE